MPFQKYDEGENIFAGLDTSESDILTSNEDLPVMVYIFGYCCHSVLKQMKCIPCKEVIVSVEFLNTDDGCFKLIFNKSRGKLLYPQLSVVNYIIYCYLIVTKLCTYFKAKFLKIKNQRKWHLV